MEKYDYRRVITDDLKDWIVNETDIIENGIPQKYDEDLYNWIYDETWSLDNITGNNWSAYAPEEKCQEYIATNLDLYFEAANEFCDFPNSGTPWIYKNPAQHMDCTIRCYLLSECIEKALEELKNATD